MSLFNQAQGSKRKANSDDNLIPLINIVFLLLIFFMIAGKIEQIQDAGLTLPDNSQTKPAIAQPITLQLSKDNEIHLNNEVVSVNELPEALSTLLQEHSANIAVRADKKVTYQDLDKVLDMLRAAGFSTINLFTLTTEAS
ncbi:outer membrane transport energization protein ExbD [Paraglaciecola sp. T6c]|uniref:ExbD/TolR family protein n=1 Tax=Pseudoalteromonas atlantica (strain T6c / ATCC BAA-1087) TaxID=3042615 RepID=UPI00005C6629|nr:biopolymer transporter ExbD [Paraglaciecola sp. T6c]ABG40794.1 outer membrane transport energization protein ExbD [Paraglaciecola sp. T6c]